MSFSSVKSSVIYIRAVARGKGSFDNIQWTESQGWASVSFYIGFFSTALIQQNTEAIANIVISFKGFTAFGALNAERIYLDRN